MAVVRRTRVRYFLGFWLFILSAVAFLDRTNISIAGLNISREYGLNNQSLGWIFSAFLIGYAGFQLPAGILAARFGPRRVLTLGVFWWGLATALTTVLPTKIPHAILVLIAVRFLLGAGEAVIYPAANQFVANWIPQQERGFINGLIFAGVGAGSGLTPPLLTWIILSQGWRAAFWFSAAVGCFAGAVWWIFSRDTPEEHPGVSRSELKEIRAGLTFEPVERTVAGIGARPDSKGIAWKAIFARKDLAALMAGYFSFGYIAWVFFSWFFLYLAQVRGFDLKLSARYTMLPFLCMTIFSLVGGSLSDRLTRLHGLRVGRCYLAAVSLFFTAIFLVVGSQVRSPQLAGVILAGGAGALYLSQSTFWSVSVDIAGRSSGVFSSLVNMAGQLGGALTASLTPWIAKHFGWTTSFAVAASMALVGAACWLVVHPERALES
ncbi:ACS family glucarate transporter-like MFS transporter [Silvibacterium bohemicum]|uniref:ACS family glucarate transporter-like MFS transporter n=1 Tax=Silvibacterium bohemicum TaxID=1577686 RepID=A0A841JPV3_9BACT|nr:MFS transporter [Silvibacterium bohemicum]MBB6142597.1 ACS family glucarate transporter-like MFS transporter [Silvibacterium bohemicum]